MGVDVGSHLTLQSEVLFAHMRRHLATIEAGKPRMSINMAATGIAIVRDGGPRLSLDYLDITSGSHPSPYQRIAANMGGAVEQMWQWRAKGAPLVAVMASTPVLPSYFQLGVPKNSATIAPIKARVELILRALKMKGAAAGRRSLNSVCV